jgi:nucleotide-binding universal stress UspA family protein
MARRILHPTDFSRASGAAFARALAEAKAGKALLTIVHALAPVIPMAGEAYVSPKVYTEMEEAGRAWAQRQMNRLLARARAAGVRARGMLVEGVAHEAIVRAARRQRADLVVIGTHGRTGVARFFLGSVAARVTATAPCPVLTVRGR